MIDDPRSPQRMGVTRKLTGLPSVKDQEKALEADGCHPIWTYEEYPRAIPRFMTEDVVVAVDPKAFGKHKGEFRTEILNRGLDAPKKKPGPKPKLADATESQWAAIKYNWRNTKPKEQHAVGVAAAMGIEVNDDQIRYRVNKEAKEAIQAAAKDEGKK